MLHALPCCIPFQHEPVAGSWSCASGPASPRLRDSRLPLCCSADCWQDRARAQGAPLDPQQPPRALVGKCPRDGAVELTFLFLPGSTMAWWVQVSHQGARGSPAISSFRLGQVIFPFHSFSSSLAFFHLAYRLFHQSAHQVTRCCIPQQTTGSSVPPFLLNNWQWSRAKYSPAGHKLPNLNSVRSLFSLTHPLAWAGDIYWVMKHQRQPISCLHTWTLPNSVRNKSHGQDMTTNLCVGSSRGLDPNPKRFWAPLNKNAYFTFCACSFFIWPLTVQCSVSQLL